MKIRIILGMTILGSVLGIARAEDSTMTRVKDDAHEARQDIDRSAHKAKRTLKHHARKAKTDIQNSADHNELRKAGRRARDAGNDALDKVDDTVHGH